MKVAELVQEILVHAGPRQDRINLLRELVDQLRDPAEMCRFQQAYAALRAVELHDGADW